jgi:hypothetical protein
MDIEYAVLELRAHLLRVGVGRNGEHGAPPSTEDVGPGLGRPVDARSYRPRPELRSNELATLRECETEAVGRVLARRCHWGAK